MLESERARTLREQECEGASDRGGREGAREREKNSCVNCFFIKTEFLIFPDLCSKIFLFFLIVKTEREKLKERNERKHALSSLAFHFFLYALLTIGSVGRSN